MTNNAEDPLTALKDAKARVEEHVVGEFPVAIVCSPRAYRAVRSAASLEDCSVALSGNCGGQIVEFDTRLSGNETWMFYDMQTYREWKEARGD